MSYLKNNRVVKCAILYMLLFVISLSGCSNLQRGLNKTILIPDDFTIIEEREDTIIAYKFFEMEFEIEDEENGASSEGIFVSEGKENKIDAIELKVIKICTMDLYQYPIEFGAIVGIEEDLPDDLQESSGEVVFSEVFKTWSGPVLENYNWNPYYPTHLDILKPNQLRVQADGIVEKEKDGDYERAKLHVNEFIMLSQSEMQVKE